MSRKKAQAVRPVVAVGASAGGVEALKEFVSFLPGEIGASFVILQHVAPDQDSRMTEILERVSRLPVEQALPDTRMMPGHIYVLQPDNYLTIEDGILRVETPMDARGLRLPIDRFMDSLARGVGRDAVGIILSGTGKDGTEGLARIKGAGGLTFAQTPDTALYGGMPESAIAARVVDRVGTLGELAEAVADLSRRMDDTPDGSLYSRRDMAVLVGLLKARLGHDFGAYKRGTIERRVRRRMNLLRFDALPDYIEHLRGNADELLRLFDDMLINVTGFFRDPAVWPAVVDKAIRPMIEGHDPASGPVRVWIPACSTGDEAYTVAMLIDETCRALGSTAEWQIFASDLDKDALAHGREALYRENAAADIGEERLERYFTREADGWRVDKRLRERVVFAQQNVLTDPPFSRLNLISCRNLLIYLDTSHQQELIQRLHFALVENGVLVLGTSETTNGRSRQFRAIDTKAHIYRRLPGRSQNIPESIRERRDSSVVVPLNGRYHAFDRRHDLSERVRRSLLERYAPATVALHADGQIAYFHGPVRRFIDQPEGEPRNNIYDMIPGALRSRVREAIGAVAKGDEPSHRPARVRLPDRDAEVCVECEMMEDGHEKLFLVSFIESDPADAHAEEETEVQRETSDRFEYELAIVREDLQTTVEELETSNEELKASNEEAVAANEELQSTNEELETSREELQSLNEELITVNNQLEEKIGEVEKTSDDMRNLLTSTRLPVLFLDPEFRISGFTPAIHEIVELRDSDIGRPVTEMAFRVTDECLIPDIRRTLRDLAPVHAEIESQDNRTFQRRIQPYRTSDERIHGVVVTFNDITEQAETQAQLQQRERQQRIIAELGQTALAARDLSGFFNEMCASLRFAMDCDYAKVLRLNRDTDRLDLVAGAGWKEGLVGNASVDTGVASQGGYTLKTENAVLVTDFARERRFDPPPLLVSHGVTSGISCLIQVGGTPWGVIGLHDRDADVFDNVDLSILQAAANVAGATIMQIEREMNMMRERLMLSLAIRSADMGVWSYDPQDGEAVWDESLRDMIGRADQKERPTADQFIAMIVEEDRERVSEALNRTIAEGASFDEEFKFRRPDGRVIWLSGRGERLIENGRTTVLGVNADITARKQNEEQSRFIMRELDHRVKNVLAIILSIAKITGRGAADFDSFLSGFEKRLQAMARTHSLLAEARWQGANLKSLIEDELAHSANRENVRIAGPRVAISAVAAQAFSMALHELCTNALKYGSLSVPDGALSVEWHIEEKGDDGARLFFRWQESNGPPVKAPDHRGFGSTVIERILRAQLSAEPQIRYEVEGLRLECTMPMERLVGSVPATAEARRPAVPQADLSPLRGKHVMVVDDEWLVAEQHGQTLVSAGAKVVGPVHSIAEARKILASGAEIDFALLDYNIGGTSIEPVLRELKERGVPTMIVSGYGSDLEIDRHDDAITFLAKPVSPAIMLNRIAGMMRGEGAATPGGGGHPA
ncbi:chemotaxis protein CheB [uncultured Croceicoccus sp.]|uniref:chemotaxis protein CheB n=1 Tax=uncultured Croceicoccus sp. TaxID=1295329 RepID=UPI0026365413|nr:chemotaxis protein CheB [uncultured Croceicoccus sp.]